MGDDVPTIEEFLAALRMTEEEYVRAVEEMREKIASAPSRPTGWPEPSGIAPPESPGSRDEPVDCAEAATNIEALTLSVLAIKHHTQRLDEYANNEGLLRTLERAMDYQARAESVGTSAGDFQDMAEDIGRDFEAARADLAWLEELWRSELELKRAWQAHYDHYCAQATSPTP